MHDYVNTILNYLMGWVQEAVPDKQQREDLVLLALGTAIPKLNADIRAAFDDKT